MATLANVSDAERRYRERNAYLDPYRFPNKPQMIVRSQFPPCSVFFPLHMVGVQLPALCECGLKSKREALHYAQRVVPDPQEQPPNDYHFKSLPRNLAELYRSVSSCNPPPIVDRRLPINFGYKPPEDMFRARHMAPPMEVPWTAEEWRSKEYDLGHVTGLHGHPQWPLCRCSQPQYHTFESRIKPVRQFGHPINGRSEALSRVGAGELIPRPPLTECRAENSLNKFPMDYQLTPFEANRGFPERLVDFPPKAARLNRWRHT